MWTSITSILFGFSLRISLDYKDGKLTWKLFITQAIASIVLSYIFFLIRRDYKWGISLDLMLAGISFFASFIVNLLDKFGKFGIKNYFLILIRRYAAEAEVDNDPSNTSTNETGNN